MFVILAFMIWIYRKLSPFVVDNALRALIFGIILSRNILKEKHCEWK